MASSKRARLFISYKRVEPDLSVAREVFEVLRQHHDVFIDQIIPGGVRWGERIEAEIRQADVFIAFLSADSICSEMVVAEISTAYQLTKSQGGRPVNSAHTSCPQRAVPVPSKRLSGCHQLGLLAGARGYTSPHRRDHACCFRGASTYWDNAG